MNLKPKYDRAESATDSALHKFVGWVDWMVHLPFTFPLVILIGILLIYIFVF